MGETALHVAAENLRYASELELSIIAVMVENGVDINCTENGGRTQLIAMVDINTNDTKSAMLVEALLEQNADVNAQNNEGETALHIT